MVSIVVAFLVNQNLYYRILTIKLVNQKRNYNGDSRQSLKRGAIEDHRRQGLLLMTILRYSNLKIS